MSKPTIQALKATPVLVPFKRKPMTAVGAIDTAALVLVDLELSDRLIGRAYLFAFSEAMLRPTVAMVEAIAPLIIGLSLEPLALQELLAKRFRLLDNHGVLGQAMAGLDMAAWDAHAQLMGQPLARALGASDTAVAAYNSCGLWIQPVNALVDESLALLREGGFSALKMRLGRADPNDDLEAVRRVRDSVGAEVNVMSDFNQALTVNQAIARTRALDHEGLGWFEEPVRHDDYAGCAKVAAAVETPIQIGENFRGISEMHQALSANAAALMMPDVQRIGGVSGWLKAAAMAEAHSVDLSSHLFPEISVHLLAASPTRQWLEYVDWANPILAQPLTIEDGHARVPDRPGTGISWNEDAVRRYTVGL